MNAATLAERRALYAAIDAVGPHLAPPTPAHSVYYGQRAHGARDCWFGTSAAICSPHPTHRRTWLVLPLQQPPGELKQHSMVCDDFGTLVPVGEQP